MSYKFKVYALKDPDTEEVFYIGRSDDVNRRVKEHIRESLEAGKNYYKEKPLVVRLFSKSPEAIKKERKSRLTGVNREKADTIISISERGKEPVVEILDSFNVDDLKDANRIEEAWIAHYLEIGHPLTNKIISSRMKPSWYRPDKKSIWKKGYAETPLKYIEQVKKKVKNKQKK